MSVTRCPHCDGLYDQDTHVEHEDVCGECWNCGKNPCTCDHDYDNWKDNQL